MDPKDTQEFIDLVLSMAQLLLVLNGTTDIKETVKC